ncbi:MAG: hypothetical protein R2823_06610 [Acidimicrobiia bacterium]
MRRLARIPALLALAAAACSSPSTVTSVTTTVPTPMSTTTTVASDEICRIGDVRFGDDGLVAALGEDVGDATAIASIHWTDSATCERVVIGFASDTGAPASSLGPTGVTVLAYAAVVRVQLPPEVDATAIADSLPDGDLVKQVFVVRDSDGMLSIDLQGAPGTAIMARAVATSSPANLIIDIIPSDAAVTPPGPTRSPAVIVMTPSPGSTIYPVSVEGYAAPGLDSLRLDLVASDGSFTRRNVPLNGWIDTWQGFEAAIGDGPSGMVSLFVGTVGPEGQQDEGATLSLDLP